MYMKTALLILHLPTILIAVVLALAFFLSSVLFRLCGNLYYGWLQLTLPKDVEPKTEQQP